MDTFVRELLPDQASRGNLSCVVLCLVEESGKLRYNLQAATRHFIPSRLGGLLMNSIDVDSESSRRIRSPAYPALNLKAAVEKAYDFYRAEGRNSAALPVTLRHWGYSEKSGSGLKALAALKSFGLVEVSGSGDSQRIKLSDLALRIILDDREDSPERLKAAAVAALRPKIHKKLWNLWRAEMPSHGNIRHHLIFEEKFNENFVDEFIKEYKSTLEYANVSDLETSEERGMTDLDHYRQDSDSSLEPQGVRPRRVQSASSCGREIAKFPVGKNCTISLVADGEHSKKSIEALVAQLKLNLELGVFDDLESHQPANKDEDADVD